MRSANDRPVDPAGRFVLYWMIAARRAASNFALDRAMAWAVEFGRPLVVFEALRVDYPLRPTGCTDSSSTAWRTTRAPSATHRCLYYPYVEPAAGAGKGCSIDSLRTPRSW